MSWGKHIKSDQCNRKIPRCSGDEFRWNINAKNNEDFAFQLQKELDARLLECDNSERKSRKEKYAIFSQCFEEIILRHSSYATLLSNIKHEYENCIEAMCRGEKEAAYLYRNLTSGISGVGTLENYKRQIQDLEKKRGIIRESNKCLKKKLKKFDEVEEVKNTKDALGASEEGIKVFSFQGHQRQAAQNVKTAQEFGEFRVKVLNYYSTSQQTNIAFLRNELLRLQNEVEELVRFFDRRFKMRKTKDCLIEKLMEKETLKSQLQENCKALKEKLLKLEERIKEERKHKELVQKPKTILELILMALKHGENEDDFIDTIEDELAVEVPEEEDPSEQEQEEMVEYMEKFEHLLSLGDYEEAAIVAATSPQDILRTAATFQRFKEQRPCPGEKSPLLFYCEAVVDNSVGPGQKGLSASESCEAVERAFDEGRRDLVVQWICQKKLKDSDALGSTIVNYCTCDRVCTCGCYLLAELLYRETKAHKKVVSCLCRQGRLHMAVHHARNVAKFRKSEFVDLLREFPSYEHAMVLLQVGDGYLSSPLCREECIASLVTGSNPEDAARLLKSPQNRIQCAKMVAFVRQEDRELWKKFETVLEQTGFVEAARDVACALVLAGVYYIVQVKISV